MCTGSACEISEVAGGSNGLLIGGATGGIGGNGPGWVGSIVVK